MNSRQPRRDSLTKKLLITKTGIGFARAFRSYLVLPTLRDAYVPALLALMDKTYRRTAKALIEQMEAEGSDGG